MNRFDDYLKEKLAKDPTLKERMRIENLRSEISGILVKWSMPTRQAAISEIMQLLTQAIEEAYKSGKSDGKAEAYDEIQMDRGNI